MSTIREWCARFISVFKNTTLDREFDDEAQSHLDLATEEYLVRGMPLAEARRLARVKFGSTSVSKDVHRDSRGLPWLEGMLHDARFALRGLKRDRAFTLTSLVMLTLAIGLNVTVFAVMDAMLFRGFPLVKRNDRLVYLQERYPSGRCCISYADFEDWRAQARTFEGIAFVGERFVPFQYGQGRPIDTSVFTVSANTFGLLGVPPMLGRDFTLADEVPGAPPVAILNYRFWVNKLGRRADIVDTTVHVNGTPATIIGVMPERFDFPTQFDLWMPIDHTPELQQSRAPQVFLAVGRLRDGVSLREARAELETINRRLEVDYPATNRGVVPTVSTHSQITSGPDAPVIWGSLWAGAWFVWLIACANVANLTLVRTLGRWREFSTRMALGAGQSRMIRHVLMESLMLALVAGGLGWWISTWSVRMWAVGTASPYQILDYTADARTLAYLTAISVAAALVVSLAPIGRVLQMGVTAGLKGDARGVTRGLRGKHLSAGLVTAQMALAIVLLAGAGVLVRSFAKIVGAETGVRDPEHVLVGLTRLPSDTYPNPLSRLAYFDRLAAQLKVIPGVEDQSIASIFPVRGVNRRSFEIDGQSNQPAGGQSSPFVTVGSDYFRVLGASAIAGRNFNDGDHAEALPVAIVNQSFVSTFWPHEQPLGQRLRTSDRNVLGPWRTVVGIVPNVMQGGDATRQSFSPVIYVPFRQQPLAGAFFFVRTRVSPTTMAPVVLAQVQKLDQDVLVEDFTTLKAKFAFQRDYMDAEHSELGKHAAVAPVFAAIALLLAAIGLAAVVAHSVTQRTKEIGVRIAIGAAVRDIRRMILREGMMPVAIGMLLGLVASLAVNRVLQSQLVGVSPYDPVTMAAASVVLLLVALLACLVPARRAMHVDPVVALRHE